jgi:hypothetical protein
MSARTSFALTLTLWALLHTTPAAAEACRPKIEIGNVQFSQAMNLRRHWAATVNVDASKCSTSTGLFSINFERSSESARDLEFTEPFVWRPGQTTVRVEFWADEAVAGYGIADVAICPCKTN